VNNYASGINHDILKWAREKAGYSLEDIALSFDKEVFVIRQWESGEAFPTYNQLERLAYTFYKRPIALFFFPEPPEEADPQQSFRTLPDFEINNLSPDTRNKIREARAMQFTLDELNEGGNPSERKIFRDIRLESSHDLVDSTQAVRNYLGVPIEKQFRWGSFEEALKNWRDIIQECGIFVFKKSFDQEDISGFCLFDENFPVIYINNSTSKSRQIFTLFHELAHLLLGTNGITKEDDSFINVLTGRSKDIEVFCNRFAAEYLVPSSDFEIRLNLNESIDRLVDRLADRYKVSHEVILRKLLDRKIIDRDYYLSRVKERNADYKKNLEGRTSGGNYYATVATYFGDKFLHIAFSKYYQGKCTIEQLSDYMNMKASTVAGLEQFMFRKASV